MTELDQVVEGATKLSVPAQSLVEREPDTYPVFFNPAAKTNRDISVAVVNAVGGRGGGSFCDSMSGLGARGIRIAMEASDKIEVALNDFNEAAINLARRNAELNGLLERTHFSHEEVNKFFFSRSRNSKFDFIDVDPFGSPARFLQGAVSAASDGTIISLTATDTPVLCGVYPKVSSRRYGSLSQRNDFKHETGIRILLNYFARTAAIQDIGVEPILAHNTRHYLRVYVRVRRGARSADQSLKSSGYIQSCRGCGSNSGSEQPLLRCPACGLAIVSAGPLWVGPLTEPNIIAKSARTCSRLGFREAERTLLALTDVDKFPAWGYDLEEVCSRLRVASVSQRNVMEELRGRGFSCIRQPLERSGIKTDADYADVVDAVRSLGQPSVRSANSLLRL